MEALRYATDDGISLEAELRLPDGRPLGSAVVCHAHPRQGGSKDHPILWAVRNELAARGLVVLAFNFRGVMRSGGSFGAGRSEVRDVAAAVDEVRRRADGPTVVCGWSFGANVALREAMTDERVSALALIGLPLEPSDLELPPLPGPAELRAFRRPVLLVSGQGDTFSPRPDLETLARRLPMAEIEIVPGTDHFLWRRERRAAARIAGFVDRVVSGYRPDR
jgi:alpha/beta superfamily hydrolase